MPKRKSHSQFTLVPVSLLLLLLAASAAIPSYGVSRILQTGVPKELSDAEGAILEENDAFFTFMMPRTVRTIAKTKGQIVTRDAAGDKAFIRDHRDQNADFWYWAHQRAREALVLALGKEPLEAAKTIGTIPFTDYIVPEYAWIATPEFKDYLEHAFEDPIYLYNPYLGVEVFLTNYQVANLEREYPNIQVERQGRVIKPTIPILEISLKDLVATPRKGEEEKVGLDAILGLPGGEIYDSLLPTSKDYKKRVPHLQKKLITASDSQLKYIPVSSQSAKELIQQMMSPEQPIDRFLLIEGSVITSKESTRFSDNLKIVANPNSFLYRYQDTHRKVFASAKIKKAQ
jgi:hypothetical protein